MSVKIDWSRADWRKSVRSVNGANCVEVAAVSKTIGVRDSKNPYGPVLELTPRDWATFVGSIREANSDGLT